MNVYRPGCIEHFILKKMRDDSTFIKELDYVMTDNGKIIGQIVYAKADVLLDNGEILPVLTMGPIAIDRSYQGQGLGKKLLEYTLSIAKNLGYGAVLIEGNYNFYHKCGFEYASIWGLKYNNMELDDLSFFLGIELKENYLKGKSGNYITPSVYICCDNFEDEFLEYETTFPYKEKLKLDTQL